MDGMSFAPFLRDPSSAKPWRYDFLVDYHGQGVPACGLVQCGAKLPAKPWGPYAGNFHENDAYNNTYQCVRSMNASMDFQYCQFKDLQVKNT